MVNTYGLLYRWTHTKLSSLSIILWNVYCLIMYQRDNRMKSFSDGFRPDEINHQNLAVCCFSQNSCFSIPRACGKRLMFASNCYALCWVFMIIIHRTNACSRTGSRIHGGVYEPLSRKMRNAKPLPVWFTVFSKRCWKLQKRTMAIALHFTHDLMVTAQLFKTNDPLLHETVPVHPRQNDQKWVPVVRYAEYAEVSG